MRARVVAIAALGSTMAVTAVAPARSREAWDLVVDGTGISSIDPALVDSYDHAARDHLYATCAKLVNNPDRPGVRGAAVVPGHSGGSRPS